MNDLRTWSIVDANGNLLYSSNDRRDVDQELARLLINDPRLRRVLRITEHTLTFHKRDEAPEDEGTPQTLTVLPWLPLDYAIPMGPLRFDQWSDVREQVTEPTRGTADELLSGLRDVRGLPVDPAVCFFTDRSITARLGDDNRDLVRRHVFLLALAGFAENTYLHERYDALNSAHCQHLFLDFNSKKPAITISRRRREGWGFGRGRVQRLQLMKPIAADARPTAGGKHPLDTLYRQPFVDALAGCAGGNDVLSKAIAQSVVPFLRANDMSEYGAPEQDVVWLVAALEQLVGLARQVDAQRLGPRITTEIADLFCGWPRAERSIVRRWMTELYKRRHEIHGRHATAAKWELWAHTLLAAVLYPLVVKALLAEASRYHFDAADIRTAAAFPARVALLETPRESDKVQLCDAWHRALVDARPAGGRVASRPRAEAQSD